MTCAREHSIKRARKDLAELDDPQAVSATRIALALKYPSLTEEAFQKSLVDLRERCERILYEVKRIPKLKNQ